MRLDVTLKAGEFGHILAIGPEVKIHFFNGVAVVVSIGTTRVRRRGCSGRVAELATAVYPEVPVVTDEEFQHALHTAWLMPLSPRRP